MRRLRKLQHKHFLIIAAALVVLGGGWAVWRGRGKLSIPTKPSTSGHAGPTTQSSDSSPGLAKPPVAPNPQHPASAIGQPTGQLISNHTISLTGTTPETSPSEVSTCQTQPNITCDIHLTGPDGQAKTLGAKTTDSYGAVEFDWNAKDIGLTPGKWKVEAIASSGGQAAASNPDYLQVNP